ncbi:hypothetical protein QRD25_18635 [Serratia marcescens]|uniref:hypothetical protein n=1 Tax=Serratia marcescens TaxID=615 RepID=UPI00257001C8|nr:hypothetical protein [Serratia marcescens]WJD87048.1 hypothetical protein QRD25_18635 [Serratia marcescens]
MSEKFNPHLHAGMEGHTVPVMQPVFVGNGVTVPTVQTVVSSNQSTSPATGQTPNQGVSNQQSPVGPANK